MSLDYWPALTQIRDEHALRCPAEHETRASTRLDILNHVPRSHWRPSRELPPDTADKKTFHTSSSHEIPLSLLARQDPVLDRILFYEDVALFEDELHDNGESTLNVRIRVMPHSFFILSRLFVRVDNVLFRIFDVRTYHEFGSNEVIRETSGYEADYDEVKAVSHPHAKSDRKCLEKRDDLSPLTDHNYVHQILGRLAKTPGRPVRPGKPWPGLGRRVEVLNLSTQVDSARDEMERLSL